MPGPKGAEKGQRNQYQVRYNAGTPCVGVWTSKDISTLPDTALVEGINIRIQDGIVVNRGGQTALLDGEETLSGCVTGLIDLQGLGVNLLLNPAGNVDTYVRYLATADQYERVTSELLFTEVLRVHPTDYTNYGRYSFVQWKGNVLVVGSDAGDNYWGLWKLIPPEIGNDATDVQAEFVVALPGTASFTPSSMVVMPASRGSGQSPEFEPIFIGTREGGVFAFDGVELKSILASGSFSSRVIVFRYNDMVYAAGRQAIKRWLSWTRGTASPLIGTWETVTLPSDPFPDGVVDFIPTCALEYQESAFVGGWDANESASVGDPGPACFLELSEAVDGTVTCSVAHAPVNSDYVFDMTILDESNALIYGIAWESATATNPARLGGYDGSTWEDELGVLTAENEAIIFRLLGVGHVIYMGALCQNGVGSGEPAGLFDVVADTFGDPLSTLTITRLVDTETLLSDAEGASDIAAW